MKFILAIMYIYAWAIIFMHSLILGFLLLGGVVFLLYKSKGNPRSPAGIALNFVHLLVALTGPIGSYMWWGILGLLLWVAVCAAVVWFSTKPAKLKLAQ